MADNKIYLCIDLKSFYASVECVELGLDPMTTNLVVADPSRGDKTICLAISPSMKALGIHNRCRVFEIPKNVEYIMAPPRMQKYVDYSADIYGVYLKYISKDDIHVYSIDEAFLDVTSYLRTYGMTAMQLAKKLMNEILDTVGVRAACGIGTNLYLTKIALDITAKQSPDFIGFLDEELYCKTLWDHKPITDFWRIGKGTAARLAKAGITTMGQVAHTDEDYLYKNFGIDAELLIDHAWGRESTTIADIKAYKPKTSSITSGQVLMHDYSFDGGRLIIREMTDLMCLDLVDRELTTASVSIIVGYSNQLHAEPAKGTASLPFYTSADAVILPAVTELYERIVDRQKPVRRIHVIFNNIISEEENAGTQLSMFDAPTQSDERLQRNKKIQKAVIDIKKRYGKDAILRGMNFLEGATTRERNHQIGGHKSGE